MVVGVQNVKIKCDGYAMFTSNSSKQTNLQTPISGGFQTAQKYKNLVKEFQLTLFCHT